MHLQCARARASMPPEGARSTLRPAALLPGLPAWIVDLSPAPQPGPGSSMQTACIRTQLSFRTRNLCISCDRQAPPDQPTGHRAGP
jgi:hypothetical protein